MAQQIPCDMCGETLADFMITNIHNGDTMAVGVECVGLFAQGVVTAAELTEAGTESDPTGPAVDPETDEPTDEPTDSAEADKPAEVEQLETDAQQRESVEG